MKACPKCKLIHARGSQFFTDCQRCGARLEPARVAGTLPRPDRGLGNTVEKAIKTVTLGLVKPCKGCEKRRDALNRLVPYGRETPPPEPPDATP